VKRLHIAAIVSLLTLSGRAQSVPKFEADAAWPSTLPNSWIFGEVSSVAVDARDHIWVLHRPRSVPADARAHAAPPVVELDSGGRFIAAWGGPSNQYEWPEREHGIYVDPKGAVWIGGNNGYGTPPPPGNSDDMLLKLTSGGAFVLQIGHSGRSRGNADTANVHQAADAYLHTPTNELFVADGYGNQRVIVFDADSGAYKRMWQASAPTPFNIVHSIKVSNDGLVYVADRGNKRVQVFTTAGEFRREAAIGASTTAAQTAAGLAFSPDARQKYLYVADLGNSQIVIIDRERMAPIGAFGRRGNAPGEFDTLHHIAVDSRGNIYTAEIGRNRRVQKFKPIS